MIARFTADQLRKIADQLDAYSALKAAGADHIKSGTVVTVDELKVAYLYWWHDQQQYMAEVVSFVPGDAELLYYHDTPAPPAVD